jgi:CubicO group peptidase (beta-lactamase class C family)
MSDIQHRIQTIIDRAVAENRERAMQVTAYLDGRKVVDCWAGTMSPGGKAIDGDTLFPVYSTTKGIAATAVHILVDRGVLDYDQPLATWWPEFAAQGKGGITLRHALGHIAGMAHMPAGPLEMVCDWDAVCRGLAALPPLHAPGAMAQYHPVSYGWLIGEPARRVDGRAFATIVRDEVSKPLGIASDVFIGVPASDLHRIATIERAPGVAPAAPPPPEPLPHVSAALTPLEEFMNTRSVQMACIPGSNGIMTARGVARHYASLIGRGVDGVRLLDDATIRKTTQRQAPEPVTDQNLGHGLGYALMGNAADPGCIFGHAGYGGSIGFADQRSGLAVGLTKNRMCGPEHVLEELKDWALKR